MFPRVPIVRAADVGADDYLLDVREIDEWEAGHAPDAHHLPMMELPARITEIPSDRDVVVVCRVGNRSAQVVDYLRSHGWARVSNLDGGMHAWQANGRPLQSEDGRAPRVI